MIRPYYEADGITIYHGDCLDILPQLDKVDLVLTDPPYGIERFKGVEKETSGVFAKKGTFKNASKWNNLKPDGALLYKIRDAGKYQVIFGGNNFDLPTSEYFIIWDKKQGMPNFARCEYAWVSPNSKIPAKIFEYPITKLNHSRWNHPAEKPLPLIKYIINLFEGKADGLILDPFMGSGTTLVAAKQLGRKAIGIEIEEKYCEIAVRRLGQMEIF